MPTLTLDHVTFEVPRIAGTGKKESRGGRLQEISLEIPEQEFFVFAGHRGCGAMALLHGLAGLLPLKAGTLKLGDQFLQGLPPKHRHMAMLCSTDALLPHLTVKKNLEFVLPLLSAQEIQKRLREVTDFFSLEKELNQHPRQLSKGQRQRIALARAVIQHPQVLLMEAPLLNLDPVAQNTLRGDLLRVHQHWKITVLYATYQPSEALCLGSTVGIVKEGNIQQVGRPWEVYQNPKNLFVAGFFGSLPMNLLGGVLTSSSKAKGSSKVITKTSDSDLFFKEKKGGNLIIPLENRSEYFPYLDKKVLLGFHPEACRVLLNSEPQGASEDPRVCSRPVFSGLADLVENFPGESWVHLQTGAQSMMSRCPDYIPPSYAGKRVHFTLNLSSIRLFDPESSLKIG